jgi:heat shock protein HtpX
MIPYTGLQQQIRRNNFFSFLLLITFPALLLAMLYSILFFVNDVEYPYDVNERFLTFSPYWIAGVAIWFLIAFLFQKQMILSVTGSKPLERTEHKRVYNLVENLCIAKGMKMPKIYIIHDESLNAFASGINQSTFSLSLSEGIIYKLKDDELENVIAHELSHIINRDVRLLVVSIIFVGIFSFLAELALRNIRHIRVGGKKGGGLVLIIVALTAIAYFLAVLLRFGISRRREFLADAGAAEMTKNPRALASALRKISGDPLIEAVNNRDVAQLFIENPKVSDGEFSLGNLFSTHPPIQKRIEYLEQF